MYNTINNFPFGYVNEQLSPNDPSFQRNEDHYGHKIEFSNNLPSRSGPTCNGLNKFHMGTHGPDAFANNTHEIMINLECNNGLAVRWKSLHPIGPPSVIAEFYSSPNGVTNRDIATGRTPTPGQPTWGDHRIIPTRAGVEDSAVLSTLLTAGEAWVASIAAYFRDTPNVTVNTLAFGATPYWRTQNSARLYDPASPNMIKRWIDLCYEPNSLSYAIDYCVTARSCSATPIAWDSPQSPFRGTVRAVDFNTFVGIVNVTNSVYWYAHPYTFDYIGQVPRFVVTRTTTNPIRMYIAKTPTTTLVGVDHLFNFAGDIQDGNGLPFHDFGRFTLKNGQTVDSGVHAPN